VVQRYPIQVLVVEQVVKAEALHLLEVTVAVAL
jgi:hypothetical protein